MSAAVTSSAMQCTANPNQLYYTRVLTVVWLDKLYGDFKFECVNLSFSNTFMYFSI